MVFSVDDPVLPVLWPNTAHYASPNPHDYGQQWAFSGRFLLSRSGKYLSTQRSYVIFKEGFPTNTRDNEWKWTRDGTLRNGHGHCMSQYPYWDPYMFEEFVFIMSCGHEWEIINAVSVFLNCLFMFILSIHFGFLALMYCQFICSCSVLEEVAIPDCKQWTKCGIERLI